VGECVSLALTVTNLFNTEIELKHIVTVIATAILFDKNKNKTFFDCEKLEQLLHVICYC